uniref:Uncharacterized protein n=1 Tax=Erpetoichthys calabaricus TaxID=27687 RepID=A0A8C4SAU6_ERPCA
MNEESSYFFPFPVAPSFFSLLIFSEKSNIVGTAVALSWRCWSSCLDSKQSGVK